MKQTKTAQKQSLIDRWVLGAKTHEGMNRRLTAAKRLRGWSLAEVKNFVEFSEKMEKGENK